MSSDFVYERLGVTKKIILTERDNGTIRACTGGDLARAEAVVLTPAEARHIARQLQFLARKIEKQARDGR